MISHDLQENGTIKLGGEDEHVCKEEQENKRPVLSRYKGEILKRRCEKQQRTPGYDQSRRQREDPYF